LVTDEQILASSGVENLLGASTVFPFDEISAHLARGCWMLRRSAKKAEENLDPEERTVCLGPVCDFFFSSTPINQHEQDS